MWSLCVTLWIMKFRHLFGLSFLDPPQGKTKELLSELIQSKKWGQNEGGDEIISVVELLAHLDQNPYLNFIAGKNSPILSLNREFVQAFFPRPPEKNRFLEYLVSKYQWQELPIYTTGCSNATNALTACLQAHGVEGGEVITTSYNYVAAPNAIVSAGAAPRFVDIDPATFCMDINAALKAVNKKTRAILLTPVNQCLDLLPLVKGLEKKGGEIALFQDVTTAMGSTLDGLGAGQVNPPPHGASVFSFAPSKVINGFGGALVVSHDLEFLKKIDSIAFHGFNPFNDEEVLAFGNNFKMNEICAAIALEQVKKKEALLAKRKQVKEWYDTALKPLIKKGEVVLQEIHGEGVVTHYMIRLKKSYHRVILEMVQRFKVGLSHWYSFHLEPIYRLKFGMVTLPVTEAMQDKIVFLPFHVAMEEKDVEYIVSSLTTVLETVDK